MLSLEKPEYFESYGFLIQKSNSSLFTLQYCYFLKFLSEKKQPKVWKSTFLLVRKLTLVSPKTLTHLEMYIIYLLTVVNSIYSKFGFSKCLVITNNFQYPDPVPVLKICTSILAIVHTFDDPWCLLYPESTVSKLHKTTPSVT